MNAFLDKGYTLEKRDQAFRTAQTMAARSGNYTIWYKFFIRVSDTEVQLYAKSNFYDNRFFSERIKHDEGAKGRYMNVWTTLEEVASQVSGQIFFTICMNDHIYIKLRPWLRRPPTEALELANIRD